MRTMEALAVTVNQVKQRVCEMIVCDNFDDAALSTDHHFLSQMVVEFASDVQILRDDLDCDYRTFGNAYWLHKEMGDVVHLLQRVLRRETSWD